MVSLTNHFTMNYFKHFTMNYFKICPIYQYEMIYKPYMCVCITGSLFSYRRYLTGGATFFAVRFQHYRNQPGFALTDYHPLAANWIVLTVQLQLGLLLFIACFPNRNPEKPEA